MSGFKLWVLGVFSWGWVVWANSPTSIMCHVPSDKRQVEHLVTNLKGPVTLKVRHWNGVIFLSEKSGLGNQIRISVDRIQAQPGYVAFLSVESPSLSQCKVDIQFLADKRAEGNSSESGVVAHLTPMSQFVQEFKISPEGRFHEPDSRILRQRGTAVLHVHMTNEMLGNFQIETELASVVVDGFAHNPRADFIRLAEFVGLPKTRFEHTKLAAQVLRRNPRNKSCTDRLAEHFPYHLIFSGW